MVWILAQSGNGTPPSWTDEFHAFTSFHAVAVSVSIALIALICSLGRSWRGDARERRLRRSIGWLMFAFFAFSTVWRLTPGQFDLNESLPLHMCRVIGWVSVISMLTGGWRWRALTFYWGFGLSTQGFVTPMWSDGYASLNFWLYWGSHALISGAAAYDLFVLGYRPSMRDLRLAWAWGLVFVVIVIAFNQVAGTNYSYLGSGQYEGTSVVDFLGPWPRRATRIVLLGGLVFFALHIVATLVLRAIGALQDRQSPRESA